MREKKRKAFRLMEFKWIFMVDIIIVCGSVMSFGLIARLFLGLDQENALVMLYVIPPMAVAVGVSTAVILHYVRKRMGTLLTGIRQVAEGDMDVALDTRDAGEYRLVYSDFNRMVRELKATKEEMQNFINEFTHEFKTPITSISGFAQYLADTGEGIEDEERMQYLRIIYEEALRLSELSQSTLLLSRVEACQIMTDKSRFSLSEQLKSCAILLLPQMERKRIALNMELPDISCYGNPEWLEQVWINMLNNAVKFTPEHGEITIHGEIREKTVSVSISDTGIGMDEETVRHIFDKYYQGDGVHAVSGNGLGLSIADRIAALSGGRIEVKSRQNEGSCFTVILPL